MKKANKQWSEEEVRFLEFSYPNKDFTIKEISIALDIPQNAIKSKANELGFKRPILENIPLGYKKCCRCGVIAKFEDFHKSNKTKDGYNSFCKYCDYSRKINKIQNPPLLVKKVCTMCNQEKSLNDFPKQKKMKDGYLNQCKICRSNLARKKYIKGAY